MQALISGADCGPVNPLAAFAKQYQQDRSIQQDRYVPLAGPSSQPFRSATPQERGQRDDAAAFFNARQAQHKQIDVATLFQALPQNNVQEQRSNWANDFSKNEIRRAATPSADWTQDFARHLQTTPKSGSPVSSAHKQQSSQSFQQNSQSWIRNSQWQPQFQQPMLQQPLLQQPYMEIQPLAIDNLRSEQDQLADAFQDAQWTSAFESQQNQRKAFSQDRSASPPLEFSQRTPQTDEALAKTARDLLDSISEDANPKFAQSQFLGLMRKFRDFETVIDGNSLIEQESNMRLADKGKGKAREDIDYTRTHRMHENFSGALDEDFQAEVSQAQDDADLRLEKETIATYAEMNAIWEAENEAREQEQAEREQTDKPLLRNFQGDGGNILDDDEYDTDDRFDVRNIIGGPTEGRLSPGRTLGRQMPQQDWSTMQDDWDAFEATATGVRPVSATARRQESAHSAARSRAAAAIRHSLQHSVTELEAHAEMEPDRPENWLALGVKQQENEREDMAIRALSQALQLDPTLCEAHLALAVSYANESNRMLSYDSIYEWVRNREEYAGILNHFAALQGKYDEASSQIDKHAFLSGCLINIAQTTSNEGIDGDLQIALGVLFNSSEEYSKARDCFLAALNVQPSNHILYNRVGATFANSGQPEDAMQYYQEALKFQPSYARARFNLAISCINTGSHQDAALHILTALGIQESEHANLSRMVGDADSGRMHDATGPMSTSLWATLETCCSLWVKTTYYAGLISQTLPSGSYRRLSSSRFGCFPQGCVIFKLKSRLHCYKI